jgi:glucokinase
MNANDFVLGIDLGGTKMALGTANARGELQHEQVLPTFAEQGAEQAIDRVMIAGQQMVEQTRAEQGGNLSAVGVASMGITLEDRVLMAPNVPGLERLALPALLQQAFSTEKVRIENDVKTAAMAELRWGELVGVDVGLYVNLGTGIAAALVVHGQVIRGSHGAAGEIAYNIRHLHDEIGVRQEHAPLEEFVGGRAVGERASLLFGKPSSAQEVFQRSQTDLTARTLVETTLTEIAFHVTNLAIALDAERIVVGGGFLHSRDIIFPRLDAQLKRFVPFPPALREAHFSHDAGLMGAVALALSLVPTSQHDGTTLDL